MDEGGGAGSLAAEGLDRLDTNQGVAFLDEIAGLATMAVTFPATSDLISLKTFIASTRQTICPTCTVSPTLTYGVRGGRRRGVEDAGQRRDDGDRWVGRGGAAAGAGPLEVRPDGARARGGARMWRLSAARSPRLRAGAGCECAGRSPSGLSRRRRCLPAPQRAP